MRASASTGPPAANGTTILIGSAACAGTASIAAANSAPNRRFMFPPACRLCAMLPSRAAAAVTSARERGAPSSTSSSRARVPRVVSAGNASGEKKPWSMISRGGAARRLREIAHHEHRHMIAARDARVEEDAVQDRRAERRDAALLHQFARQRLPDGLAGLDPAAGQMPARHVAVLDQKDPAVRGRSRPRARPWSGRGRNANRSAKPAGSRAPARGGGRLNPFHKRIIRKSLRAPHG